MAQSESSVQVGEFSKKSLDQLKKTFAPSLESIFEARKTASDAGAETAKKVSGSTGLLALLIKPFKRLAALLGVAALAVIAFVAALNRNKDKLKDALKNIFTAETFAKAAGIQLLIEKLTKSLTPDPKKAKSTGKIVDTWRAWVAKWDKFILEIKNSKTLLTMQAKWGQMTKAIALFFKPITDFLFEGGKEGKGPKVKADGKWTKFIEWMRTTGRLGLSALGWIAKLFRPLYIVYVAYEAIIAGIEADDKLLNEAKEMGLDKPGMFKRIGTSWSAIQTKVTDLVVGEMIIGTAGWIVRNLFELLPKSWVYDEDGSITIFGKKYAFGEEWDLGGRFNKWRKELLAGWTKWFTDALKPRDDGLDWSHDLDKWMSDIVSNMKNWFMNLLKTLVPDIFLPDELKATGGMATTPSDASKNIGETDQERADRVSGRTGFKPKTAGTDWQKIQDMAAEKEANKPGMFSKAISGVKSKAKQFGSVIGNLFGGDVDSPEKIATIKKSRWNNIGIDPDTSDKGMKGTDWNALGGLDFIQDKILGVYNKYGSSWNEGPMFTSGKRTATVNKETGGLTTSQHIRGTAFDLRNRMIPIPHRDFIAGELQKALGSKLNVIRHAELDLDAPHFHIQKAAKGVSELINGPKLYLAGEAGPEIVHIQPLRDPANQTNAMRNMGADMSFGMGGFGGGGITTVVDASSNNSNATVLAVGNGPHPAPIDDGLHYR